jgi:farnesyl diphosphate synthase
VQSHRQKWLNRVEQMLDTSLPNLSDNTATLHQAMRYSSIGAGKRLRAMLVYATGEMLNVSEDILDYPAAAVEMVHAYSLIHDDLPAMDDDDLRRGKPTCHRAFNEAVAILAGDALQARAFELLSDPASGVSPTQAIRMLNLLANASGGEGMAGGQVVDLEAVGNLLSVDDLQIMHRMKTGALIRASVLLGAMCTSDTDDATYAALGDYADAIGLAFQVVDDILDETMDSSVLGKASGADRALNKPTYTSILGIERAREVAEELHQQSLASLATIRHNTTNLQQLADLVVNRHH